MKAVQLKKKREQRRRNHVRRGIKMHSDRPRLSIHRTLKHIYAQLIDDEKGVTVCAAGSGSKSFIDANSGKTKTQRAAAVGSEIARLAKEKGVEEVVFDRGSSKYHGRVKALAEAAREGGLKF